MATSPARTRRRARSLAAGRPTAARSGWRGCIGAVVTLGAIWSLVSVFARPSWRHWGEETFGAVNLPVGANLFSVALLVLLAGAVRRRLRVALWILVLFQVLALVDGAALVGVVFTHQHRLPAGPLRPVPTARTCCSAPSPRSC